jgi:predicted secreted Zn-dependent protease
MTTLTIAIDARTEADLRRLSEVHHAEPGELAARLLARAVRAARSRPAYDIEALKAYAAEHAAEEAVLADSDPQHRADLLAGEDAA